jgi:hypothetical protein
MHNQRKVAGASEGTVGKPDSIRGFHILRLRCLGCHFRIEREDAIKVEKKNLEKRASDVWYYLRCLMKELFL